tara:strand:+ start:125 stop:427 length:303 start_codon:yes stop_codon:yes gene_type:complete
MKPIENNSTVKRLYVDFMDALVLRRGIIKTLYYLSFNPRYVISNYIENRRGNFPGPVLVFYICFIAWALMMFAGGKIKILLISSLVTLSPTFVWFLFMEW